MNQRRELILANNFTTGPGRECSERSLVNVFGEEMYRTIAEDKVTATYVIAGEALRPESERTASGNGVNTVDTIAGIEDIVAGVGVSVETTRSE